MEVSADILREMAGAQTRETQLLIIELCGVFWITAELVILFFVLEARRHLGRNPVPATPVWDRAASRRTGIFLLLMASTLGAVLVRPLLWAPLSTCLQHGPLDTTTSAMLDFQAVLRHLVVWAAFVTAWVVLEAAIVYQGYRAYRMLRSRILQGTEGQSTTQASPQSMLVLLLFAALAGTAMSSVTACAAQPALASSVKAVDHWSQVLTTSENWLFPYRNAMYLYLRIAGVVWIGLEWIAAFVLWRTWRLINRALRVGGSLS